MIDTIITGHGHPAAAADKAAITAQNWNLLQKFNIYRVFMAFAFLAIALIPGNFPPFGETSPGWFVLASLLFTVTGVAAIFSIRLRTPDFDSQTTILAFLDIALITLIMHTSGGLSSGLGLLLLVSVAEFSVLLSRRMTIFFASLSTIAALIEHSWPILTGTGVSIQVISQGYPQVGVLGIGLFITGTLGNTLATRLRSTAALAEKRGLDLANLASVNELIIERMQSGVVVCDNGGHVREMNNAAMTFLGIDEVIQHQLLSDIAEELDKQLKENSENPVERTTRILRTTVGYALLPRFVLLGKKSNPLGTLIFLEDTEILKQQAQQLKMAALARLTASIAHEIRNPLSAVTNAAQLLKESTTGNEETQRLLSIMENHSHRMNVIVENITQLSRRDRTEPVRIPIDEWMSEFVVQYAQGGDVPVEAVTVYNDKSGLQACVDPDQLFQIMANLCQNALRHSPAYADKPLIKIQTYVSEQGRPMIDVVDWGSGVREDIVDSIFDPFFTTTPQGTGLGLYICRELCESNGGRLEYTPNSGGGSVFRITLSRAEECYEANPV
ncbi:MAG: ATP-binding protein [Acidiferrobacterales bacterium]